MAALTGHHHSVAESPATSAESATQIRSWWSHQNPSLGTDTPDGAAKVVRSLAAAGWLDVPLPGRGQTAKRFGVLATVGELDLTAGRLVEAHADAAAILVELDHPPVRPGEFWGVWAAEPPNARVQAALDGDGAWHLSGRKAWCGGAGICTNALVTAHADDGPRLFAVDLAESGIATVDGTWHALALTGSGTRSVDFDNTPVAAVGGPDQYVGRPGFWHGASGVAAVWFGGAVAVARALLAAADRRPLDDIALAHLGAVDVALAAARDSLSAAAAQIDADPHDRLGQAAIVARRTRGVVEASGAAVIEHVGRALGAAPLAMDRLHARRVADLELYLRQSHAERDLADLAGRVIESGDPW
jgi:alkylation response protein AidB-like acyl-CoA dehydrogenase